MASWMSLRRPAGLRTAGSLRTVGRRLRSLLRGALAAGKDRVATLVRRPVAEQAEGTRAAVRARPPARTWARAAASGNAGDRPRGAVRVARSLSAVVAVLMASASAAGLWWTSLYQDPASAVAMFRGYDLVSLFVAAPLLAGATAAARRRSPRAQLLWAGMLAYVFYTYAYYVFGAAFNALFLVHVALMVLSLVALGAMAAGLDVRGLADRFRSGTPVRFVSAVLALLAAALGGMWIFFSARFALTGATPPQGLLVQSAPILHLGYAMDLAVLVPGYATAAALLWRRRPWGYALATVLLTSSGITQLAYMVALLFQSTADIPGATAFDPQEPFIAAAILGAAAAMMTNLGRTPDAAGLRSP